MSRKLIVIALALLSGCNLFTSSSSNNAATPDAAGPNNVSNSIPDMSNPAPDTGTHLDGDMGNPPEDMPTDTPDGDVAGDAGPTGDFAWDRGGRVQHNLLLHYTFDEGSGSEAADSALRGGTPPLTLGGTATWLPDRNGVHVDGPGRVTGAAVGHAIWDWVTPREEITVEVWLRPDNLTQDGPARIVTFSADSSIRNFTIGQDATAYNIRFAVNDREFSRNGTPELSATSAVTLTETHIAFTYDGIQLKLFVNGVQEGSSKRTGGLQNWDRDFAFVLGNENASSRPWAGEIYQLSVYDRALSPPEVLQNFLAGAQVD